MNVTMWTDASRLNTGEAFIAVVVQIDGTAIGAATEYLGNISSFRAELMGIYRATQLAIMMGLSEVTICCDNQAAVMRATPGRVARPLPDFWNLSLQAGLFAMQRSFTSYCVKWVPSKQNPAHRVVREAVSLAAWKMDAPFPPVIEGEMRLHFCIPSPPAPLTSDEEQVSSPEAGQDCGGCGA